MKPMMLRAIVMMMVLSVPFFTGCGGSRGTLVAAGGSMHDENGEVHARILKGSNGLIGIVTTASGDGVDAFRSKQEGFAKWAPGRTVVDIGLREDHPEKADDAAVVALIDRCDVLFFTGGDQKRIVEVFRPKMGAGEKSRRDSAAYKAVIRLLDRGGTLAGTSAGAAMMGDVMFHSGQIEPSVTYWGKQSSDQRAAVRRAFSESGLFDIADKGTLKLGTGMGLVRDCIVDSHFAERKRLGRLEIALDITGESWGIGVNENRAVVIDRASGRAEAIGGTDEVCTVVRREPEAWWKLNGGATFVVGEVPSVSR